MIICAWVLLSFLAISSRAGDYQSILTLISAGNSECNSDVLLGDFDLKTVPQFNALCNIPIPDNQQTEFLLENNAVPILCVGLLDVSLRLCKSANDDISRFVDIFPPSNDKFKKIFLSLSKSDEFSSLEKFCSVTVKNFAIQKAASNVTDSWWQVLNKQLSDEKNCSIICHSNAGSKVNPLCSYILWSNGLYFNYKKNQVEAGNQESALGEVQESPVVQKSEEVPDNIPDTRLIKNDVSMKPTDVVNTSDLFPSSGDKIQTAEGTKSNFAADNNNVGVGTVEQVVNNGDQTVITDASKTDVNPSVDKVKLMKKDVKPKSKHPKNKEAITSKPSGGSKTEVGAITQEKPKISLAANQTEEKVVPNASAAEVPSNQVEPQGQLSGNAKGEAPTVPVSQKPGEAKQKPETGKVGESMVEGDFSLEMTPGVSLDPPITAEKDFQPHYSDDEGEDGDGDDVEMPETNAANTNTETNSSKPVASKGNIQQGSLEGDKVYGEGEILIEDHFIEAEDSHFFPYFLCMAVLTIMAYLAFHNKKKLLALAVEGRKTKGGRRRPNSSHYSKLDCSLEEALVSNTTASVTHVLY